MIGNGQNMDNVQTFMLTNAIKSGSLDTVTRILNDSRMDINGKIDESWTPFLLASFHCQFDIMVHLLNLGADVKFCHHFFNSLMAACSSACSDEELVLRCVRFLINQGLPINERDIHRTTALMFAAQHGHIEVVKELLSKDALIDNQDSEGWSALFHAVSQKHIEVAKLLLEKGASVKLEDRRGRRIIDIAEAKGLYDLVALISGDNENKEEDYEPPVLHVVQSYRDMVRELPGNDEFMADSLNFLHNLFLERYSRSFFKKKVSLGSLLLMDDEGLKENGVYLSSHRKLILSSIKKFHLTTWKNCFGVNRDQKLQSDELAFFLANITRHLYTLTHSTRYIKMQSDKKGNGVFHDEFRSIILKNVDQLAFIERKLEQFRDLGTALQKHDKVQYVDLINEKTLSIRNKVLSKFFKLYLPSSIFMFILLRNRNLIPVCVKFVLTYAAHLKLPKLW